MALLLILLCKNKGCPTKTIGIVAPIEAQEHMQKMNAKDDIYILCTYANKKKQLKE